VSQEFEQALDGVDGSRRSFLKKMAVTTAFAAPVVSSFTMTGIKAVYAQTPRVSGVVSGGQASPGTTATTAGPNQTTTTTTMQQNSTATTSQPDS
jgi:hypothetical protein